MILGSLDGELRPYLRYSAALHAALVVAAAVLLRRGASREGQTYRIDFIGPTAGIINREVEASGKGAAPPASAAASRAVPPQSHPDEFSARRRRAPLPRPSVLSSSPEPARKPEASPAPEPAEASPPSAAPSSPGMPSGTEPAGASVAADMPNFPYPWYIAQVRASLWQAWSSRMPHGGGDVMIEFEILRNGGVTDLRVESSSGDRQLDDAALAAAQAAGSSFPPLPRGFAEAFLKIHVKFTSD